MRGGVDLRATTIETVIVDGDYRVRGQAGHPTPEKASSAVSSSGATDPAR